MINELYELSTSLNGAKIQAQRWHRKYGAIPTIRATAPCVRILVSTGNVVGLSLVDERYSTILRKYGSNQGSYPCMNLAPLYRVTDGSVKRVLNDIVSHPEILNAEMVEKLKEWCSEDNWCEKFLRKYEISMEKIPSELCLIAPEYTPLKVLISDSQYFTDPSFFHSKLESVIWKMLERREDVALALNMLFHRGKEGNNANDDYGSVSIALESSSLIEMGTPAISEKFVMELNRSLLSAASFSRSASEINIVDAFGVSFVPIEEPMPSVKLAGGFDVTIRTMFKDKRCQTVYGRIENASYPISPQVRMDLQAALGWISCPEQKNVTWINTDKNEIMFVYPSVLTESPVSYTSMFKRPTDQESLFEARAKKFIHELLQTRDAGSDTCANQLQIFIIRKVDKARTKVVYTRQTDPYELERCSEEWALGCANLPAFLFGSPKTLFPLDIADILNRFRRQDGKPVTDKFKPFPRCHGIELLMEPALSVVSDLHRAVGNAMNLGAFLGNLCARTDLYRSIWEEAKDTLALVGLLLYRKKIRKDDYMDNLPYLYGQLLKAADELHALYCNVVRKGEFPSQFAGSSLFQSAAEAPVRSLNVLSQRIMPYYTWAKSYRLKDVEEEGKESWRAGWLYSMCEKTSANLRDNWTMQTRFNDEEKAQLFIGYLAAFPKKERRENEFINNATEEVISND